MEDKSLDCINCQAPFWWTVGEQKFLQRLVDSGKINELTPPKRCPDCRAARKINKANSSGV